MDLDEKEELEEDEVFNSFFLRRNGCILEDCRFKKIKKHGLGGLVID